jgi:hypothetical protein
MRKLQLAIIAAALVIAAEARASLFDITFTSNDRSTLAVASVTADPLGGGAFEATAGSITVSGLNTPFTQGNYGLVPNPNYPGSTAALVSQSGYFIYDDQVLSGQNPFLTNPGLLFLGPGNSTIELNLFSNGASSPVPNGTYQLYDNTGVNLYGDATIRAVVPEPTTMIAGTLLLLPFGASTIRILRKRVTA